MHTCDHDDLPAGSGGPLALLAAPARMLGNALAYAARRHDERRAVATLVSMDDHLLRDIGLTRGDAERLVREGRRC